jgi:hypothetical protein
LSVDADEKTDLRCGFSGFGGGGSDIIMPADDNFKGTGLRGTVSGRGGGDVIMLADQSGKTGRRGRASNVGCSDSNTLAKEEMAESNANYIAEGHMFINNNLQGRHAGACRALETYTKAVKDGGKMDIKAMQDGEGVKGHLTLVLTNDHSADEWKVPGDDKVMQKSGQGAGEYLADVKGSEERITVNDKGGGGIKLSNGVLGVVCARGGAEGALGALCACGANGAAGGIGVQNADGAHCAVSVCDADSVFHSELQYFEHKEGSAGECCRDFNQHKEGGAGERGLDFNQHQEGGAGERCLDFDQNKEGGTDGCCLEPIQKKEGGAIGRFIIFGTDTEGIVNERFLHFLSDTSCVDGGGCQKIDLGVSGFKVQRRWGSRQLGRWLLG